ncbi:MAG: RraA family protein [Armatimonadota bacterium]|nr:RraA family protein [Armatimonadota bacterium]
MDPLIARLARLAPSTLGHFVEEGFLDIQIRPIFRPVKLVGRALTVSAPPKDNAIYRRAIREARPGDVLVIHRNGDLRHASFGGLLGLAARNRGIAGAVLDGPCTDIVELTELGLPVYSLGISALTTRRLDLGGTVGEPIACGGVRVATGDYVLADDDGVLVIPAAGAAIVIERGEAAARREAETRAYLLSGKTLDEIDAIRSREG